MVLSQGAELAEESRRLAAGIGQRFRDRRDDGEAEVGVLPEHSDELLARDESGLDRFQRLRSKTIGPVSKSTPESPERRRDR